MSRYGTVVIVVLVAAFFLIQGALFTVDQTELALVVQLGKPVREIDDPGLYFKVPFIQNVTSFEKRLLLYDASPKEIITKDKKSLVVDNYSRWKITEPLKFYKTVFNEIGAQRRLDDIIYAQLREELGKHTLLEIVSEKRAGIMETVTARSDETAGKYGIEIYDVRIKRADLPKENEEHVYGRMKAERQRQAKKYRSEGEEEALKLRAKADKDKTIILAEAYKEAQDIKGEGDAEAIRIYADAYERDPEFFSFVKSLEVYRQAMKEGTKLVISSDSKIFEYLNEGG